MLNSAATPTPAGTVIDAAVIANGAIWTVPLDVAAGDTLRMWMSGASVSANPAKTGLTVAYI